MGEHAPNGIVTPVTCCAIYLSVYIFVDFHCIFFSTGGGVAWVECIQKRLDTRPIPVADGWTGVDRGGNACFHTFQLDHHGPTDQRTNGPKDRRADGQSLIDLRVGN